MPITAGESFNPITQKRGKITTEKGTFLPKSDAELFRRALAAKQAKQREQAEVIESGNFSALPPLDIRPLSTATRSSRAQIEHKFHGFEQFPVSVNQTGIRSLFATIVWPFNAGDPLDISNLNPDPDRTGNPTAIHDQSNDPIRVFNFEAKGLNLLDRMRGPDTRFV